MPNNPNTLSNHLFWDVDANKIDWTTDAGFIIHRVIEYGKLQDWDTIKRYYGKAFIKEQVVKFRSLDDVSLSFLCVIFDLNLEDFRCYRLKQSNLSSWNY